MATKAGVIDFRTLTCGVPTHVLVRLLSRATCGVNFRGCTKTSMAACWDDSSYSIDRPQFAKFVAEWRTAQASREADAEANALDVKCGDEVTVLQSNRVMEITKVTNVDLARRTIATESEPSGPYAINGQMVRRSCATDRYECIVPTTEAHRRVLRLSQLTRALAHAPWVRLPEARLREILAEVESARAADEEVE